MSERPYKWGTGDMTSIMRSIVIPTLREALLDAGVVEPTTEERADMERRAAAARVWQAERAAKLTIARERLAAITDPVARAVLDLHAPDDDGDCMGDDMKGYEAEQPTWPCRTVEAVAAHYGIPLDGEQAS